MNFPLFSARLAPSICDSTPATDCETLMGASFIPKMAAGPFPYNEYINCGFNCQRGGRQN